MTATSDKSDLRGGQCIAITDLGGGQLQEKWLVGRSSF